MEKKILENAVRFLERTQLKGEEVPAYVEVMQMLHSLSEEKPLQNAE